MKLWLIEQDENSTWDTYDAAVVACDTEEEARHIHPSEYKKEGWWNEDQRFSSWALPEHVSVRYLGEAAADVARGVVCASFNAG